MNLGTIDFNLLKVLDALIDERNVTRAGKRLGRSQPAVSNALHRLRELFGDDLLVRGPNGFLLTPRAEAMRKPLREAITLVEGCLSDGMQFNPANATGVFRLSTPDRLSLAVIPQLHARLQKLAPNTSLQVLTADRKQALDLLDDDRTDLALGWLDEKPSHLKTEFMIEESLFCVFRRDHPLLKRRKALDIEFNSFVSTSHRQRDRPTNGDFRRPSPASWPAASGAGGGDELHHRASPADGQRHDRRLHQPGCKRIREIVWAGETTGAHQNRQDLDQYGLADAQ